MKEWAVQPRFRIRQGSAPATKRGSRARVSWAGKRALVSRASSTWAAEMTVKGLDALAADDVVDHDDEIELRDVEREDGDVGVCGARGVANGGAEAAGGEGVAGLRP